MSGEWKPGDVAMRTYFGKSTRTMLVAGCNQHNELGPHWHHFGGGWDILGGNDGPTYRPLVMIDPEDRDEVARLVNLYEDRRPGNTRLLDHMTTALREFANPTPPKPAEPTGLGAVVEDGEGARWVQFSSKTGNWWRSRQGENARWTALHVVSVLSEGVTA